MEMWTRKGRRIRGVDVEANLSIDEKKAKMLLAVVLLLLLLQQGCSFVASLRLRFLCFACKAAAAPLQQTGRFPGFFFFFLEPWMNM